MIDFFKKYHKWLSIVLAFFIVTFALSGIFLNHRQTFSSVDISRNILPKDYRYNNWNNAGVKSTLKLNSDSILIYGNIGIWLTDSTFNEFSDFNQGFPKGIDNRKICKLFKSNTQEIFAGTYFGLYKFDSISKSWIYIEIPATQKRITDIFQKQDTTLILTRSHLLKTTDYKDFKIQKLPPPENYDNKIGLFKTLWVIHSGEVYGHIGKLVVDLVALIFILLTVTGTTIFINKYILKKNKKPQKKKRKLKLSNRRNLKWHNKIGWITAIILIITTLTGIFLRPPLLAAIGNSRVNKIPYTELATPNPWFDILRKVFYDNENERYILATMNGFYYSDNDFNSELKRYKVQPPASVMGVNVFKKTETNTYLIGSFEGLFLWNPENGEIFDYIKKEKYTAPKKKGRPIGDYLITGYTDDFDNKEIYFDYNTGAAEVNKNGTFVKFPKNIKDNAPMSLWNLSLEFHTARIYQTIIGDFYILIVPLVGLSILFIQISGVIVWYVRFRKNSNGKGLKSKFYKNNNA